MAPRPLLLDFGGVVLLTPFELRERAAVTLGPLAWRGPFDPAADSEWRRFQHGAITERQYWAGRAAEHGLETMAFMRHFYDPPGRHLVRPEMERVIHGHRRAGGAVGMLTNDLQAFHGRRWMEALAIIGAFDFVIDGSLTGVLKPSPQAFEAALAAFGEPDPAAVVFVDDQPVNVRGAAEAGLTTVWFDPTDVDGSVAGIEAALGALGAGQP